MRISSGVSTVNRALPTDDHRPGIGNRIIDCRHVLNVAWPRALRFVPAAAPVRAKALPLVGACAVIPMVDPMRVRLRQSEAKKYARISPLFKIHWEGYHRTCHSCARASMTREFVKSRGSPISPSSLTRGRRSSRELRLLQADPGRRSPRNLAHTTKRNGWRAGFVRRKAAD